MSALVLAVVLGLPIYVTMVIMVVVAIAYTTIGGIMADVYSDFIPLIILYGGILVALIYSKIATPATRISEDWTLKGILNKHPEKQSWLKDKRVYTLVIYTFVIIIVSIIVSRVLHSIL